MANSDINAGEYEPLRQYVARMTKEERSYLLLKLAGWFCDGDGNRPRQEARREFWTAVEQLTMVERAAETVEQKGRRQI